MRRLLAGSNRKTTFVLALTISSAVLIPPIAGAIGGQAKAANRLKLEAARGTSFTRAKHIGLAVILYASAHKSTFPKASSSAAAFREVAPYDKTKDLFVSLNPNGRRFEFNLALSGKPMAGPNVAQMVLAYDEKPWPDQSRIVVFGDGHAEILSQTAWKKVLPNR